MDVNNVNSMQGANAATYSNSASGAKTAEAITNEAVVAAQEEEKDVYEPSDKKVYKPDAAKVKQMWADHDAKVESFRKLVEGLFKKQAEKDGVASGTWNGDKLIEIDAETRAAAQKEIDEGGYYSVDETAKRLLNFAVALSGGDPSKIEELKSAVEKGFKMAENMWGGELPSISGQTYDAVMKGFEEWEAAGDSSAITLLNEK